MNFPSHDSLGDLLTTRRKGVVSLLVEIPVGSLLVLLGVALLINWIRAIFQPISKPGDIVGLLLMLALGVLLAFIGWRVLRWTLSVFRFYEHGATRTILFWTVQSVAYKDAATLRYVVTRNYYNGIYTGTHVDLRMSFPSGKDFRYDGKHKQRPDGLLSHTFIRKNFKGEDELDAIKNIISVTMVQRWLEAGDFRVNWASGCLLTPKGIEIIGRTELGRVIPYAEIQNIARDEKYLRVYLPIAKPSFVLADSTRENYYPGLELLLALKAAADDRAARVQSPAEQSAS